MSIRIPVILVIRDADERRRHRDALRRDEGIDLCRAAGRMTEGDLPAWVGKDRAVVVLDTNLPNGGPARIIGRARLEHPGVNCLLWVAGEDTDRALMLLAHGARGAVPKSEGVEALCAAIRALGAGESHLSRTFYSRILEEWQAQRAPNPGLSI